MGHGEVLEGAEGGHAGAEVIEGHGAAMATHDGDELHGGRHVGDDGGFGDLEAQPLANGRPGLRQGRIHHLHKAGIHHRQTRHIEADPLDPLQGSQGGEQRNRFLEHPLVEAGDQLKPFGRRQEGPRQHQGTVLLADAQQQFRPQGIAIGGVEGHDPLGMEFEAVVVNGPLQPGHPAHRLVAADQVRIAFPPGVPTVAARLLGRETAGVGSLHHRIGIKALAHQGHHADAHPDAEALFRLLIADILEHPDDPPGRRLGLRHRAVGQKQAELIPTQTGQARLGAAERFQQPGHLHQQAIAGGMAGGVVDDLELVEVDVEERVARLARLGRLLQALAEAGIEGPAVEQLGEGVVAGLVLKLFPKSHLGGHVLDETEEPRDHSGWIPQGLGLGMHVDHTAVAAEQPKAHLKVPRFRRRLGPFSEHRAPILRMDGVGPAAAPALLEVEAVDLLPTRIGEGAGPLPIGGVETDRHAGTDPLSLLPQTHLRQQGTTPLQQMHGGAAELAQHLALLIREPQRLPGDHAEGAHGGTISQVQGGTGIEADAGIARDQGIGGETGIELGVLHHKQIALLDGVGAEGDGPGGLAHPLQAHIGLEPLAIVVDQADQGDRRAADGCGGMHQAIEGGLRAAVEHRQPVEAVLPAGLSVHG